MGPVICGNKTFNTIVASLGHNYRNSKHYVLRHMILKNFPDADSNLKKLAWKLYAMNLRAVVGSYGIKGARDLIKEKFIYQSYDPHASLISFYQSIRYLRHQCVEQSVCATDLYKKLGNVLNAVAHEIAMEEAIKAKAPWE
jgi:hypothetical protein